MLPDDERHGSTTGYRGGCRCISCRRAIADSMAQRRARQYLARSSVLSASAVGPKRRIQALVALGWSLSAISSEMGYSRSHAALILRRGDVIQQATADRVSEVYDRLSMRLPPERTKTERIDATRARNMARRNGWPPPLAWDDPDRDAQPHGSTDSNDLDPVVVDRILGGDFTLAPTATKAERVAVVAAWSGTLNELERLTGWRADRYRTRGAA